MTSSEKKQTTCGMRICLFPTVVIVLVLLIGCGSPNELQAYTDFAPIERDDWDVSTPDAEGLDPELVGKLTKRF